MSVSEALERLGGVATREALVAITSRAGVDRALDVGDVLVPARGRYVLPGADRARAAAHTLSGTVCLASAAMLHGWAVKTVPARPQVAVPRNRRLRVEQTRGVEVRRLDLGVDDVRGGVTSPDRTLLDCGRLLPPDEALAIFDSALRAGLSPQRIAVIGRDARGAGAARVRRAASLASALAANPFESATRSIAEDVPGLHVRPQVPLWGTEFLGCVDLADADLRIVIECDSFEWHGGRGDLARDARRYNRMVVNGWLVLRFSWEDVMFDPAYVAEVLRAAVAERTEVMRSCPTCRSGAV